MVCGYCCLWCVVIVACGVWLLLPVVCSCCCLRCVVVVACGVWLLLPVVCDYLIFLYTFRNCIGQEFALNEERVVLSHILRHFELSLDETKLPIKKDFLIILRPKGGLHLKLSRRAV